MLYIKDITRQHKDMNLIFEWQKQYFNHSLRLFIKYCFPLENKIHIFKPLCNFLFIIIIDKSVWTNDHERAGNDIINILTSGYMENTSLSSQM